MIRKQAATWFLLAIAGVAFYLCYRIAQPFLNPIFASIVLAIVFYPLHLRIESRFRRPGVAAAVSTLVVMLVVAIPLVFLGGAATRELGQLYQSLNQKSAVAGGMSPYLHNLADMPRQLIGRYIDLSHFDLHAALLRGVNQLSSYMVGVGVNAVSNLFAVLLGTVVVFFTLFFLFRDGRMIQKDAVAILPLTAEQAHRLGKGISETIVASVYGGIAVGLAQGSLTGLAFWVLGLSSPVLWAIMAALSSLIPMVGTGLVWGPAALALLIGGHWVKALILAVWGVAVVSQVDALIRMYVIGGHAKMHNLLIFFALLGGVKAFGIMGLFIGPVVVSVTIAVIDMLRETNSSEEQERNASRPAA